MWSHQKVCNLPHQGNSRLRTFAVSCDRFYLVAPQICIYISNRFEWLSFSWPMEPSRLKTVISMRATADRKTYRYFKGRRHD